MCLFESYLSLWVALCIVVGIGLGHLLPGAFEVIAGLKIANVNLMVAGMMWFMIVPMLLRVDFGELHSLRQHCAASASRSW